MIKILLSLFIISTSILAEAILQIDTKGHTGIIRKIIVTKSGDIISASDDKTIRVWDANTGKEKRKILGQIGNNQEGKIYSIALSNNEKYLAVSGFINSGNKEKIRIYNYQTGKLLKILKSHTNVVLDLSFSKDGQYLISASFDTSVKIWDVKKDFELKDTIKFHTDKVYSARIIKKEDNYFAITVGYDSKIALYDIQKKKLLKSYKYNYRLNSIAITQKNGGNIAVCGFSKEIFIYDINLNRIKIIKNNTRPSRLSYSKDGKYLIVGDASSPNRINIYKVVPEYTKIISFKKHTNLTMAVDFLNNTTAVSAGGDNREIYIWDINTAKVKRKIEGVGSSVWSVGINGYDIALGNNWTENHGKSKLEKYINLKTFKISKYIESNPIFNKINTNNNSYSLSHSKGGKFGFNDAVLEIKKDGIVQTEIIKNVNNGVRHRCYGWYKDFIISGGDTGQLGIYTKEGKKVASLVGHIGVIYSISIDGDRLISGSSDQTIRIWDLSKITAKSKYNEKYINRMIKKYNTSRETFLRVAKKKGIKRIYLNNKIIKPTLNLFISKDNEYVAWTNEGFFNASKGGAKYIGYHINQGPNKEAEYVTVDALYSTFYRPDLIQKALAGESLKKYAKNINIQKLLQDGLAPEVHILTKTTNTEKQDLDLKVQVCPKSKGGYDNLTLLINDMPVSVINTSRALKLKKKSKRDDCFIYNQSITLAGGANNIGFRATNKAGNIESKPDFIEVTFDDTNLKKKLRGKLAKISENQNINDLHILAIAVNEYKDKELTLNYSINDATVMLKTIEDVAKPLFNKVHTYKLFDKEVTKNNIKKAFKDIKSTREDVFLLYIAGHGITDEYNGNYYFIPYDFEDKDNTSAVQAQGVGQKDLMLGLSNITALKSLVLLDTCNSGSFVEADMQKTTTNRLARATGRATISASSKSQVALEGYKGHGVFTYTLIEALKGKGYNDKNKITINGLNDYIEKTLPDRTQNKWGYRQEPQSSMYGVDFNIGAK